MHVIKIGGSVVDSPHLLHDVLTRCVALGEPFVLVHGGGKIATKLAADLGVEQTMVDGRRITDAETLRIVTMTYGGLVNKTIVAQLQALGCNCVGLTGADADLVRAHRRTHPTIDFGFVGDVDAVNTRVLDMFLTNGMSVVVAPLTHDGNGTLLNTNADTMAAEIAMAIRHRSPQLAYLFEYPGVMRNIDDATSMIPRIDPDEVDEYVEQGVITKGMLPKITNAVRAARSGVSVIIQHADALGTTVGTVIG